MLQISATVYDLLYKNVFDLKEVDYAVNKMLHDKTSRDQREQIPFLSTGYHMQIGYYKIFIVPYIYI